MKQDQLDPVKQPLGALAVAQFDVDHTKLGKNELQEM